MALNQRWKGLLPKKKNLYYYLSTLLLTLGVYLAFPERGIFATFPLLYVFSVASSLFVPGAFFNLSVSAGIALLYGMMADLPDPVSFVLLSGLSALCGSLSLRALRSVGSGKRLAGSLRFFAFLLAGILLTPVFMGTPTAYTAVREEMKAYLEATYPDQRFTDLNLYYAIREKGYRVTVQYENEGNLPTSELFYQDGVKKDGFREDFAIWMLDIRKAYLIKLCHEGAPHDLVFDSLGYTEEGNQLEVYYGAFGELREEMLPWMHFRATFRSEAVTRKSFSEAVRDTFLFLQENQVEYGKITFLGMDGDTQRYSCTVTPETDPDEILSLCLFLS